MPTQKRFGAATKSKGCTCGQCKALVPAGVDRWFDNTVFPRKPICGDCYLLAVDTPAPDLTALIDFFRAELPGLIAKGIQLASEGDLETVERFPDLPPETISDNFID